MRTQSGGKPLRTLYAFNPLRSAILLIWGREDGRRLPTRNFRELLEAMPPDRQRRIEKRFQESLAAMPLDQLRKAQQMTQLQLAEVLGVSQGEVSKIEHRSDICVSTLAEYVEAMGGRLEIRVKIEK